MYKVIILGKPLPPPTQPDDAPAPTAAWLVVFLQCSSAHPRCRRPSSVLAVAFRTVKMTQKPTASLLLPFRRTIIDSRSDSWAFCALMMTGERLRQHYAGAHPQVRPDDRYDASALDEHRIKSATPVQQSALISLSAYRADSVSSSKPVATVEIEGGDISHRLSPASPRALAAVFLKSMSTSNQFT